MVAFNRLFEDEEGVSEVVGTILTLGITVVLFSSVYAGVSTLDSPERRDHLEMDVVYEPYNLTISHQGGKTLEIDNLEFTVLSEGETFRYTTEDDELSGPRGDEWSVGQTVNLDLSDESGELGSDMELVIQNQDSNRVIYQTDVSMQELGRADINNAYIRYIHDWRNYAEQGEEIDIVAELSNIEGIDDNEINVNVSVSDGQLWADHEEGENISLERASGNKYENRSIQISPVAEEDRYSIKIVADIAGNESEEWVRLNVGKKPAEENPKELEIGRIDYTPSFPSHGEDITITAEVFNHGPENFTTEWSMFDSFKEDEEEVANDTDVTISAGPAPTEISGEFEIRGSGTHGIRVKVDGNEEWDGAEKSFELTVDPHVLVVEDRSADQLPEAELMSNALSGLNLDHQVKSVESADDVSEINFKDHSIIVWMSGNETGDGEEEDTTLLENSDVADDLTSYVDNERGNLWVLGVNLDDVYDGNGADLNNYLGGIDWNDNEEDSTTSVRGANETGPFFREPIFDLNPVDYSDGQSQIDYHEMDLSNSDSLNKLVEVDDEGDDTETYFGGGYDQFDNDQRTVTNSFLFDMIQDPGLRTAVAGEVIGWATNISVRSGVDVAVTSQNIEPSSPMYLDTINITATFRNNGPRDLTLNNTARLVRSDGEEVISPPDDANLFLEANGGTAEVTFEWTADELGVHKFLVKADYIGEIDQANPETNDITYKNLDITDDEIYANVHYSTMVVDADLSNDKDFYDTAGEVTDAFDRLGHEEGSDYEVYDVGMDENEIEDGPSASNMSNFNSVFWITGERGEADDAQPIFTDADISNINDYLNQSGGGNMLFMGEHMLDFLNENNEDDLIEMMGVDPNNIDDRKETDVLKGLENNPVGHGLRYELGSDLNYTTFETDDDGDVIFQGSGGQNLSSTYDDGNVKTIYMGVDIERIEGPMLSDGAFSDWPAGDVNTSKESARTEFVYGSIWNFGKSGETVEVDGEVTPEGRTELRVSDYDIRLNTDRPHTGRSYEVRAEIENIGYRGASTLVRFYDGEDYIGAENLFVEGSERESEPGSSYFEVESGTATAEVSWSPSHPGLRDLIVEVDPEREVDEIQDEDGNKIMELNNRAEIEQPVYFFYDDMEEGEQKWRHDETLVNIDGSGPLDFADRRDMETNVEGDWDHEKSGMTYEDGSSEFGDGYYETDDEDVEDFTDKAHYSSPRSYWMPETPAGMEERQPVDVVMMIDDSGSMKTDDNNDGNTRLDDAQEAAISFVKKLGPEDRVALYSLGEMEESYMYMTGDENNGNKSDMIDAIDDLTADGSTPLWDSIGAAINHVINPVNGNRREDEAYEMTMPLTDGDDQAYDLEEGSDTYCPGAPPGTDYDDRTWGHTDGNVWGDPGRDYYGQGGSGLGWHDDVQRSWSQESLEWEDIAGADSRTGLIEAPIPSYPIALGITPHEDDLENPENDYFKFTTEFDLWQIAETSDGSYYYAPESDELDEIFQDIYDEIPGRRGGIRSVSPDDGSTLSSNQQIASIEEEYEETIQIEEPTYFRYTTTPSIEIVNTTAEKLRFRNKYWMTEGTNGGIMYLWGSNDGNWDWEKDTRRYIKPEQSYTGNLDFEETDNHTDEGGLMINDDHPEGTGLIDREGEEPYWAFNGKSAGGTFGWRHTSVDLEGYEDFMEKHTEIRVVFVTAQMGGISEETGWKPEMGWYIDNVNMRVTRDVDSGLNEGEHGWMRVNENDVIDMFGEIGNDHQDGYYQDNTKEDREGHYWMFANNSGGEPKLPEGVDSSLYSSRIDLSNADRPEFSANLKFNLDNRAGTPPDGLRIEISEDDGRTWDSLTYGVRSGWGVSGEVPNNLEDEDAKEEWENYSGGSDGYDWIDTDSLSRVSADLSGWRGEQVILRFRVFTNTTDTYEDELDDFEYDDDYPKAIMIDDVIVKEADMDEDIDQDSTLKTEDVSDEELSSVSKDDSEDQDIRSMISKEAQGVYRDSQILISRLERQILLITRELEDVKEREFNYW